MTSKISHDTSVLSTGTLSLRLPSGSQLVLGLHSSISPLCSFGCHRFHGDDRHREALPTGSLLRVPSADAEQPGHLRVPSDYHNKDIRPTETRLIGCTYRRAPCELSQNFVGPALQFGIHALTQVWVTNRHSFLHVKLLS